MNKDEMEYQKWVYCPVCGNKTRVRLRKDTNRSNFGRGGYAGYDVAWW